MITTPQAQVTEELRIGSRVKISPRHKFAADWRGDWIVVGMTLEYQKADGSQINYAIASAEEIEHRLGSTDGWDRDDLIPVESALSPPPAREVEAIHETLQKVAPAVEALATHQIQMDEDGIVVGVSRQALDEILTAVEFCAAQALARVRGEK